MPYLSETPIQVQARLQGEWTYLDVRTEEEFAAGHVPASYNIPVALRSGSSMAPNEQFIATVRAHFAPDTALVVGCAAGGRSARACEILEREGFTSLVNMDGGFAGARDVSGQVVVPGWVACGLPVETDLDPERSYAGLSGSSDPA